MSDKPLRLAGHPWRILVHDQDRKPHDTSSDKLPGTEFDELVVGQSIHLEQMDTGRWWMNIGGVTVWLYADEDGKPTAVSVYGPDDYAEPVDGCDYHLTWTSPPAPVGGLDRHNTNPKETP